MIDCFIDTETTGKTPTKDRVVEFAGVKYKDGLPTGEVLSILINPERAIPLDTTEIHGITDDDVKDKPRFKVVMAQILDFIRGTRVIAHNGVDFDFKILEEEFKRNDSPESLAESAGELVDSLLIARKVRPGKSASINALCKEYGVDNTKRVFHGALLDCELLAEVYKGLVRDIKEKNIDLTVDHELDFPRKNPIKRIKDGRTGIYVKVTEEQLTKHQEYMEEFLPKQTKVNASM